MQDNIIQEIAIAKSSSDADILEQPSTRSDGTPRPPTSPGSFKNLSAEIRLKIYELVLPVDAFFSRRYPSADGAALILTCKLINREAYPIFLSRNNFDIDYSLPFYYHAAHDFYQHVRQISLGWSSNSALDDETTALEVGKGNFEMIKHLYKFLRLQILHISGFWAADREYMNLEDHWREDGVAQTYLERSGIKAFLEIPGLTKITFSDNPLIAQGKSKSLIALEKYAAEHLRDSQLDIFDPAIWKGRVVSCLREAFGGTGDDYSEDEIPQQVVYCKS